MLITDLTSAKCRQMGNNQLRKRMHAEFSITGFLWELDPLREHVMLSVPWF